MTATLRTSRLRPEPGSAAEIVVDARVTEARPAIVFLHGLTSTRIGRKSETLLPWAENLGLPFARFDFRGHGDSDGEMQSVSMTDLIADTAAVVNLVGPGVLIGSSLGGLAAAWFAASQPDQVRALVLLSPALGFLPEMAKRASSFEIRRGADEDTMSLSEAVLLDAQKYDESSLPESLQVPVMLVHGTDDDTVAPRLSEDFCRRVPHANKEFWLIDGGSHSLNEDFDAIVPRVESFLIEHGVVVRP